MRHITHIVLHCTATPQNTTIESIQKYWREHNGWKSPGYHYIIKPSGEAVNLLPIEKVSNGVAGHNSHSIHISYIGGIDSKSHALDNRTQPQKDKQVELLKKFKAMFPEAIICGHRDFLTKGKPGWKECPSFDVKEWLADIEFEASTNA